MHMTKYDKKPFPWRCSNCGEKSIYEAILDYTTQMPHDRCEYTVRVSGLRAARCTNCGKVKLDVEALDAVDAAFRCQLNLLTPEQIHEQRLKTKLTSSDLASALGVEDFVVQQLEPGDQIQSRTLDNLMRLLFGLAQPQDLLARQPASAHPPTAVAV